MSPPATRRAQSASTTSGTPPRAKPATGVPQASASAMTRPYGSSHIGVTTATDAAPTSRQSAAWSRCPTYWTSAPSSGATAERKYCASPIGPARTIARPAMRAACTARCGAFSGTIRPVHTAGPPPGPIGHRRRSTPFGMTSTWGSTVRHRRMVYPLTATNRIGEHPAACTADSSHGVGGVCSVVTIGMLTAAAIATGR